MRLSAALPLSLVCLLTGCAMTSTSTPTAETGYALRGNVHGGQQPIVGAHVYLFAANTTGYGGNGIAASALNASVSLLTNVPGSTTLDMSGGPTNGDYYVTTAADGSFSITNDYTCTQNTQVYLYALGGNPGAGANSASGLLAALGNCPAALNFATQTPFVWINEVSTIAAAYAFAGFATDATHVSSSGTALAKTGIANAFANAANLASISTGAALATTPAGNGIVPQSKINTLANILASCVNSTGTVTGPSSPSTCYTLFNNAMNGTTAPTETATAAIDIAHNPAANIAALYAIPAPTIAFASALQTQPNDFTMGLSFPIRSYAFALAIDNAGNAWIPIDTGPGSLMKFSPAGVVLSGTNDFAGGGIIASFGIAIDRPGNIWVTDAYTPAALSEFSNSGVPISGSTGYTGGGLNSPLSIAFDVAGDAWVPNSGRGVSEFLNTGVPLSGNFGFMYNNMSSTNGGVNDGQGVAVDGAGAVWVTSYDTAAVAKLSPAGVFLTGAGGITGGGMVGSTSIALDAAGNAWIADYKGNNVVKFSNSGVVLSGSGGFSGGGLSKPAWIAIDGAGNGWIANFGGVSVTELSSSGSILSGSNGYVATNMNNPNALAIDGSGNVWSTNSSSLYMNELIGAATPVITPIAAGLPTIPTTDGSSNLGTRP